MGFSAFFARVTRLFGDQNMDDRVFYDEFSTFKGTGKQRVGKLAHV